MATAQKEVSTEGRLLEASLSSKETAGADHIAGSKEGSLPDRKRKLGLNAIVFNQFLNVFQQACAIQSEVELFTKACHGNAAATSRAMSTSTGILGVVALIANQLGGKLSDCYGRKPMILSIPFIVITAMGAILRNPDKLFVLMAARIIKGIFLTFGGSVMTGAYINDLAAGEELAAMQPKIAVAVGAAVIAAPVAEAALLKKTRDPRATFKLLSCVCALNGVLNGVLLPESLMPHKRASFATLKSSISSINPLAFFKVYGSQTSPVFKKMFTILTLQFCSDGKVGSDMVQLWSKNNLGLDETQRRNFVVTWGLSVLVSGILTQPLLMKRLSSYNFTQLGNALLFSGFVTYGLKAHVAFMFAGLGLQLPVINNGSSNNVRALCSALARKEGFGLGEFSAFLNNARTILQSFTSFAMGWWYAFCIERGLHPGSAWWIVGILCGLFPELIMWTMSKDDFALAK